VKGDLASSQFEFGKTLCIYKNMDKNPSTKSIRHVKANVNTPNKCKHMREN
jgi:hypothetical protein